MENGLLSATDGPPRFTHFGLHTAVGMLLENQRAGGNAYSPPVYLLTRRELQPQNATLGEARGALGKWRVEDDGDRTPREGATAALRAALEVDDHIAAESVIRWHRSLPVQNCVASASNWTWEVRRVLERGSRRRTRCRTLVGLHGTRTDRGSA